MLLTEGLCNGKRWAFFLTNLPALSSSKLPVGKYDLSVASQKLTESFMVLKDCEPGYVSVLQTALRLG